MKRYSTYLVDITYKENTNLKILPTRKYKFKIIAKLQYTDIEWLKFLKS